MYYKGELKNQLLGIRKLKGLDMKVEGASTRHGHLLIRSLIHPSTHC